MPTRLRTNPSPTTGETRGRSLAKTISWRVVATTTTFAIAWGITGDVGAGAAIGGIEGVAKLFLYYGHERAWSRTSRL